ncbi:phage tail protein [Shigella flexneri]|nr:phage tail protein [Shigella flexneri]
MEIKKIINPRYTESGAVDCDVFFLTTGTRQFPTQPPLMMLHRRVSKSGRNCKVANGVR